jgi:hypothetical protein
LDDLDEIRKKKMEKMMKEINNHKDVGAIHCDNP